MLRKLLIICALLLQGLSVDAQLPAHIANQVSGEEYNTKEFSLAKTPADTRTGVYHFGDSEGEWDLVLMKNGSIFMVQVWRGQWATHRYSRQLTWQKVCKTFNKVATSGSKITFGTCTAVFVDYHDGNKIIASLLLDADPFTGKKYKPGHADVGHYYGAVDAFMEADERNELSRTILPDSYFSTKTPAQLKIMRNTVYAKYGMLFQPGGEVENYFKTKSWYDPYLTDVSLLLTDIEKENIATLMRLEKSVTPAR